MVEHWAFSTTNEIVSGLESGVHTHEFVERGLKATFKLANGRLLTRDAGSLTYRITFDENDEEIDFEVVSIRGATPSLRRRPFLLDTRTGTRPRLIAKRLSGPTTALGRSQVRGRAERRGRNSR